MPLPRIAPLLFVLVAALHGQAPPPSAPTFPGQPAYKTDLAFTSEVGMARTPGTSTEAQIIHWKKAAALSGNACAECFERIATLSFRSGAFEPAVDAARSFEQLSTKPADKAYAELLQGSALFHLHDDKPTRLDLDNADAALKAAILNQPDLRSALYLDGRALAALRRNTEARAAFTRYVELAPADDRYRARAQRYIANLALARAAMAPPFTVTTAAGKRLALDDMGGRVVLLDFWATWCVPCRQLLPRLKQLQANLADQPFVLLSVSWDEDVDAWQKYVADNGMSWPQYLDKDHELSDSYGVDSLPHYFTIDADGVLQSEVIGVGDDNIEARVRALLAKGKAAPATR